MSTSDTCLKDSLPSKCNIKYLVLIINAKRFGIRINKAMGFIPTAMPRKMASYRRIAVRKNIAKK